MKILLGLSGGVDSSVAALILKEQGHEVIGAKMTIQSANILKGPKTAQGGNSCYGCDEEEGVEAARKVAEQLDIPFHVFDCSGLHEKFVLENFKKEYLNGRTPNPCILCNALIKFGALPKAAKESGLNFDKFATGHYARIEDGILKRGLDPKKDQSYFIYRLSQEQLANTLLPLGSYTKAEIREIARRHGLIVADKPDSQDFYSGDYNELLEIEPKIGNIIDKEGKILGTHEGIWNYTVGQRKGLPGGAAEPLYVLELRKETNEVVVGFVDSAFKKGLIADNLSWISKPEFPADLTAKIRSTQDPVPVRVKEENNEIRVEFEDLQKSITPGQSIVFYDGDLVLGGGIINEAF